MHHVPYTHTLQIGKTVIQHIYDAHYDGARDAERLVRNGTTLKGRVDEARFQETLNDLIYQAGHAQVCATRSANWFLGKSGIADDKNRVGNYPDRFEAEAMQLDGYEANDVKPWETASGGQASQCVRQRTAAPSRLSSTGKPGWFDFEVAYFDENDGVSKFKLLVAGQVVDEWTADDKLPHDLPSGHTSTRRETRHVALRPDDVIRLEGSRRPRRASRDRLSGNRAGRVVDAFGVRHTPKVVLLSQLITRIAAGLFQRQRKSDGPFC